MIEATTVSNFIFGHSHFLLGSLSTVRLLVFFSLLQFLRSFFILILATAHTKYGARCRFFLCVKSQVFIENIQLTFKVILLVGFYFRFYQVLVNHQFIC